MPDSPLANERRRVVMTAVRDYADSTDMTRVPSPAYHDLMTTVEGQVRAVLSGRDIPDEQRRYVVKSAIRDMADGVDRADDSDARFSDVMTTVEGQVRRVLRAHGVLLQ